MKPKSKIVTTNTWGPHLIPSILIYWCTLFTSLNCFHIFWTKYNKSPGAFGAPNQIKRRMMYSSFGGRSGTSPSIFTLFRPSVFIVDHVDLSNNPSKPGSPNFAVDRIVAQRNQQCSWCTLAACACTSYNPSPKPARFTACIVTIFINEPVLDVGAQASELGSPDHGTWSKAWTLQISQQILKQWLRVL